MYIITILSEQLAKTAQEERAKMPQKALDKYIAILRQHAKKGYGGVKEFPPYFNLSLIPMLKASGLTVEETKSFWSGHKICITWDKALPLKMGYSGYSSGY